MRSDDCVHYEVVRIPDSRTYGVMQFVNNVPTGIDFHWLTLFDARRAKHAYESGYATHGNETERTLRRVW